VESHRTLVDRENLFPTESVLPAELRVCFSLELNPIPVRTLTHLFLKAKISQASCLGRTVLRSHPDRVQWWRKEKTECP
jgi:hypothetical protein